MRSPGFLLRSGFLYGVLLGCGLALPVCTLAQSAASPPAGPGGARSGAVAPGGKPAPVQGVADPLVGSVEGHPIYLSDLGEASRTLPGAAILLTKCLNARAVGLQQLRCPVCRFVVHHDHLIVRKDLR